MRKAHPVFFNTTHSDPGRSVNCPQSAERSFRGEEKRGEQRGEEKVREETRDETRPPDQIADRGHERE
jgi:hypothetical protein